MYYSKFCIHQWKDNSGSFSSIITSLIQKDNIIIVINTMKFKIILIDYFNSYVGQSNLDIQSE